MSIFNVNGIEVTGNGNSYKGKTLLAIGDSITENNTKNDNKSWCEYMHDMLGFDVVNDGKSGTGLIKGYGSFKSFTNRVDGVYVGTVNYDSINPDVVLIMGNGNDTSGGAYYGYDGNIVSMTYLPVGNPTDDKNALTVYGATRHIIEKLIERYPLAKIGWILSTPRNQNLSSGNFQDKGGIFDNYTIAIKEVCAEYGVPVLDMFHNSSLRPFNETNVAEYYNESLTDTFVVHPNTKAIKEVMINPIAQFIIDNF